MKLTAQGHQFRVRSGLIRIPRPPPPRRHRCPRAGKIIPTGGPAGARRQTQRKKKNKLYAYLPVVRASAGFFTQLFCRRIVINGRARGDGGAVGVVPEGPDRAFSVLTTTRCQFRRPDNKTFHVRRNIRRRTKKVMKESNNLKGYPCKYSSSQNQTYVQKNKAFPNPISRYSQNPDNPRAIAPIKINKKQIQIMCKTHTTGGEALKHLLLLRA